MTTTYIPIASQTLTSAAASVAFSSIPQTYRDLVLVSSGTGLVTGFELQLVHFNNDLTNSNYASVRMSADAGFGAYSDTANSPRVGNIYGNHFSNTILQIMDYSATDKHKTYLARVHTFATDGITIAEAGRWANTGAINEVRLSPSGSSFNSGTTFALYGIEA